MTGPYATEKNIPRNLEDPKNHSLDASRLHAFAIQIFSHPMTAEIASNFLF